ncbi:polysaccharide deacetylase family protein [Ramlibacter algicola]|uniref:Polysaccharide deacetylase family protein n=1 Tax=Ramlibacter algicola TaxID=2795217 RepID=A0A934Q368_9BURK|nr:polysaccharide deacetylase family protein [Ramlibacter algicola]MBK0394156.1 polysaccharide deacetylase family protein [Ramlibacter algicola]
MASGPSTTRRVDRRRFAAAVACAALAPAWSKAQDRSQPLYLTFDTGHMGVAGLVADVLARHQVPVTFFGAHERTKEGDGSLGDHWAPWWKARAAEGHEFASHTYDHAYWRADLPDGRFRIRPSAGPREGQDLTLDAAQYCAEIERGARRLDVVTGKPSLPLFRAPGGKTSPRLLAAARGCGWEHVGWSPAGFLGDELPSESVSNDQLLARALRNVRAGDILLAHLGIWSRKDPWAPAVLEPLVTGLKQRGFAFRTLRDHPRYAGWIARHARTR